MSPVCATCDGPIKRAGETRTGLGVYVHLSLTLGHDARPKPRCPKCDSFDYQPYESNWGFGSRCGGCGHDQYCSIGD